MTWLDSGGWKPTFDGTATLVAGVIAFAAVQWQLWRQRKTRRDDQDAENRSLATAILFEIDLIYRSMVSETTKAFKNASEDEFVVKAHASHFPIYEGNASKLGRLPPDIVQDIVGCYGMLTRHLLTLQQYSMATQNAHGAQGDIDWKGMASQYRVHLAQSGPTLKLFIWNVTRRLCEYLRVAFEAPTVAVAAENIEALKQG